MPPDANAINERLDELERCIFAGPFRDEALTTRMWGGADVIISDELTDETRKWLGSQGLVISYQSTEPRRRAVITPHAKELSLLFERLRDIAQGRIDHMSKYDFFGTLAQAGLDYQQDHPDDKSSEGLLRSVIDAARSFLK